MAARRVVPDDGYLRDTAVSGRPRNVSQHARQIDLKEPTLRQHLRNHPDLAAALQAQYAENREPGELKAGRSAVGQEVGADGLRAEGGELRLASEPAPSRRRQVSPDSDEVTAFLTRRGVDLDRWVPVFAQLREYPQVIGPGQVQSMEYIRVDCKPVTGMVVLRVAPKPKIRTFRPQRPRRGDPELIFVTSCAQIPFHDERVIEAQYRFLADVQPHRGIDLGDFFDYASMNKHPQTPAMRENVADSHVTGHVIASERIRASPATDWVMMPGNHDHFMPQYLRVRVPAVADLAAVCETVPWWHPRKMIHLDELGIRYVDGQDGGDWFTARVKLSQTLRAMHGWRTGKATAARETARELGCSVLVGHTHRQAITPVTIGRDDEHYLVQAMEVGCACRVPLPYNKGIADWQQGWGLVSLWPDGQYHFELVQVLDGQVRWRGKRYAPTTRRPVAA